MDPRRKRILICDRDRSDAMRLAHELDDLGYETCVVLRYAEAFACACAFEIDALVLTPQLDRGASLLLPTALGMRRPPIVILVSKMSERLPPSIVERAGFDKQLTKVVDAEAVDEIVDRTGDPKKKKRRVRPRARGRAHVSLVAWTSDRS